MRTLQVEATYPDVCLRVMGKDIMSGNRVINLYNGYEELTHNLKVLHYLMLYQTSDYRHIMYPYYN